MAPVSGSLESTDPSSLAAAEREIREETGLEPHRDLRLEFVAPSFQFVDEAAGRGWKVWAFGWRLLEGWEERLRLDWEHDGWEEVEVMGILEAREDWRARCVPRVEESLRRVWWGRGGIFGKEEWMERDGEGGKVFDAGMERLKGDLEHGARVLATEAVRCLLEIVRVWNGEKVSAERVWRVLRIAGWHLVHSARPSMNAAIGAAVVEALSRLKKSLNIGTTTQERLVETLQNCVAARKATSTKISNTTTDYVLSTLPQNVDTINILTLSSSSTIKSALRHLIASLTTRRSSHSTQIRSLEIYVLESRPRCEGVSLAAKLVKYCRARQPDPETSATKASSIPNSEQSGQEPSGGNRPLVRVTVAPDSHGALLLQRMLAGQLRCSYLLLGADRISSAGDVLNKTLSLSTAIVAKSLSVSMTGGAGLQVVVVAESDKIEAADDETERRPPQTGGLGEDEADKDPARQYMRLAHSVEEGGPDDVMAAWEYAGVRHEDVQELQRALSADINQQGRDASKSDAAVDVEVKIENTTFEWVPAEYIDVYLTEDGVSDKEVIKKKAKDRARTEKEVWRGMYDG